MGYKVAKHTQEHVRAVAQQYGLSTVTVDAVIDAYIADMCDTLRTGTNVNIPHLVTVGVKPNDSGGYQTYSTVSKVLRLELRGTTTPPKRKTQKKAKPATTLPLSNDLLASIDLGIPGIRIGG